MNITMKQLKSLTMLALMLLMGVTMTSCFSDDTESTYDNGGIVHVRSVMGISYFEDQAGNTYYPTQESLNSFIANNPGFDLSDYRMANILYKWVDNGEGSGQASSGTQSPRRYDINLVYFSPVDVITVETVSDQATLESSIAETAPVLPLDGGYTEAGIPGYYDENTIVTLLGYYLTSLTTDIKNKHKVRVACVDEEIQSGSAELTLYVRHDRGDDNGTTNYYNNYTGLDVRNVISYFRQKAGQYPARIVLKAKTTGYATTTLPTGYTTYTVNYKAPTE